MAVEKTVSEIPSGVLHATRLTPQQLKVELAVHLFEEEKLSFGRARQLTDVTVWQFMQLSGSRGIPMHHDVAEYAEDLETLRRLGRL